MKTKIIFILLMITICFSFSKQVNNYTDSSVYYLDSERGDDNNNGLSPSAALKTLAKASTLSLKAGDKLLLKGGQVFKGTLILDSVSGKPALPVIISSYANSRAIIMSGDSTAFKASNCNFMVVKNLICKGSGRLNGNDANGFDFIDNTNLFVDSVEASGYLFSGINFMGGSHIRITNAYAHDNGYCGIHVTADRKGKENTQGKPIRNIYIGYSVAENNPGCPKIKDNHSGNGILVGGVTNGTIEYCESMRNGWDMPRKGNGPVGIWAYQSDRITIQHCYAHHNATSPEGKDGGGFDFDGGVTNSVMQYNLSVLNEGPGYGIFQYAGAQEWYNNVVRYNISYQDGIKNGQCGILMWCDPAAIPMKGFHAYNNTIVNKFGHGINFLPGHYENFVFENNILSLTGNANKFVGGEFTGALFNNNLYWSEKPADKTFPPFNNFIDSSLVLLDPMIEMPDNETIKVNSINEVNSIPWFRLKKNSPARNSGKKIDSPGEFDYWGNTLLNFENPSIGAYSLTHSYAMPGKELLKMAEKILYKKTPQEDMYLYLLRPEKTAKEALPAIIYFTGGGWVMGDVANQIPIAAWFTEHGIVSITADYRVKSRHQTSPLECIADAKSAVRYVRIHAKELGIDPNRIILAGGSAGGHIAACTQLEGGDEPGENLKISTKPNALVLHNPALGVGYGTEFFSKHPEFSPVLNVKKNFPPTIITCGTDDELTPISGAMEFIDKMHKSGNVSELITIEGAGHSCDWPVSNPNFYPAMKGIIAFLKQNKIIGEN